MSAVGGIVAVLLLTAAGWSVLRLVGPRTLTLGAPGRLAGSYVAGAATLSFVTTVAAVLGGPVHLALTAPVLGIVLGAGVVDAVRARAWRSVRLPSRPGVWTDVAGLVAVLASLPLVLVAAAQHMTENDEFSIWAFKGRALDSVGHVDTFLLARDPVYSFSNRDYPLMLPSLQTWGNGWTGSDDERFAHLLLALLTCAALVLAVVLLARLTHPVVAVVGLLLVLAVKGFLAQATFFVGDAPTAMLALALLLAVAQLTRADVAGDERRGLAVLAAVCAAAGAMTKNEGTVFLLAVLVAGVVFARTGRRWLAVPAVAGLVAVLPWSVWSRAHGLHSDFANTGNLRLATLRTNASRTGHILDRVGFYWPGVGWVALAVAAVALLVALALGRDRTVLIVPVGGLLALAALVLVEVLADQSGEGFYRYSLPRILLFPAAVLALSGLTALAPLLRRPATPEAGAAAPADAAVDRLVGDAPGQAGSIPRPA